MARNRKSRRNDRTDQSGATSKSKERYDNISGPTGTKPGDPGVSNESSKGDSEVPKDGHNDPEWYNADPQLLLDSASFPYAYPLGDSLELEAGDSNSNIVFTDAKSTALPGVCALKIKPSYGFSRTMKDPLNVCANAFYTHVRYVNSGRKNYDASDLMLYALSWSDIYSAIMWAERLYQIAFTYSQRNKYIGDTLLKLNYVDPDGFRDNLANFRYRLNAFINKVSSFAVPASINIFKRRAFMYTALYLENRDMNIKDQLYMFIPDGFYRFALDNDGKGKLEYSQIISSSQWDAAGVMSYLESLLDNITGDEDFGIMSGDILKAYGDKIIGLAPLGEEAYITPMHDPFVLSQFKNAVIPVHLLHTSGQKLTYKESTDDTHTYVFGDLCQDPNGVLLSAEAIAKGSTWQDCCDYGYLRGNKPISVENPVPGPADSIEASRLVVSTKKSVGEIYVAEAGQGYAVNEKPRLLVCGTEIAVESIIAQFIDDTLQKYEPTRINRVGNLIPVPMNDTAATALYAGDLNYLKAVLMSNAFRYHPMYLAAPVNKTTAGAPLVVSMLTFISNVDNYTIVSSTELEKMHECALLSLFFVPGVAKMVNYM